MNKEWAEKDYAEIDLGALTQALYKQKWLILTFTLSLMFIVALISFYVLPPIYQAQTSLLVLQGDLTPQATRLDDGNLQSIITNMSKLPELTINTYVQQTKDPVLLSKIITELNLVPEGYSVKKLGGMIKATAIKDTNLIEIKVQNQNPELAVSIAQTLTSMLLDSISQSTQAQLTKTLTFLQEQATAISDELAGERARLQSLATLPRGINSSDYQDVERRVTELEKTLDLLSEKIIAARITKAVDLRDTSLQVISPALLLERPVKPNKIINVTLAGVGGLIIITLLVLGWECLNNKLKSSTEIERKLGLPVYGSIPKIANLEPDQAVISYAHPKSIESEAFRVLRTNFQFVAAAKELKTLLITSTAPGEGKSTLAVNLATVLAQTGKRILLVDADLRSPVQHRLLAQNNYLGLANILAESFRPDLAIINTSIPCLALLPSGPIPLNPAELLASDRMGAIVSEFKESFDYVIFDASPILAVTDGVILASKVDGVFLVVKAGNTQGNMAKEAVANLQRAKAQILGVILNSVEKTSRDHYYYDYYSRQGEQS